MGRIRTVLSLVVAIGLLVMATFRSPAAAAVRPNFGTDFKTVTLDGIRLGEDFTPVNFNSDYPTVVFDPATGIFHMWVHNDTGYALSSFVHAISLDGIHFTSTGTLSYAGGAPYPAFGAAAEPTFQFVRAVRVGTDWKLLMWTPFEGSGQFDYNVSVFDIGTNPNNLSVTLQGPVQPVPMGTSGLADGPWGLIGSSLFVEYDPVGGIARFPYTDAAPPSVTAAPDATKDLITPTGFVNFNSNPASPNAAYVSNAARTLVETPGTLLATFYALRSYPAGTRLNKEIYYIASMDGGATWSDPVFLFTDGNLVTVDGLPNQGNFSHPEVTLATTLRLYFSTTAADGKSVVVTAAAAAVPSTVPMMNAAGLGMLVLLLTLAALLSFRPRRAASMARTSS